MPDAFRPEILAAFMQHVVDQPELPVLFLRTVSNIASLTLISLIVPLILTRLFKPSQHTRPIFRVSFRLFY